MTAQAFDNRIQNIPLSAKHVFPRIWPQYPYFGPRCTAQKVCGGTLGFFNRRPATPLENHAYKKQQKPAQIIPISDLF
jgi:hypothetical protein